MKFKPITYNTMNELIDQYVSKGGSNHFLKHVDYFNENNKINVTSIKNKWHELTGESKWTTWMKGCITIQGANKTNPSGCPYQNDWTAREIMPRLKHPCDTGIVKEDGNIDVETLRIMMYNNFCYSEEHSCYYLPKSQMMKYLEMCEKRDENFAKTTGSWIISSWRSVAETEWNTFYDTFCDFTLGDDKCITATTFLEFYFSCDELYKRILEQKNS